MRAFTTKTSALHLVAVFSLASAMSLPAMAAKTTTANVNADVANVSATTVNIKATTINMLSPITANSITEQYKHLWWINGGMGLTTGVSSDDPVDLGFNVSLNLQPTKHQLLTFRSAGADFIGGDYYDVGLLYGLVSRNPNGYVSAGAGVSEVFFNQSAFLPSKNISANAFGVPFEVQAFWTPVQNFGVGVIGYANANDQKSFYGLVLAIQLANLVPL